MNVVLEKGRRVNVELECVLPIDVDVTGGREEEEEEEEDGTPFLLELVVVE